MRIPKVPAVLLKTNGSFMSTHNQEPPGIPDVSCEQALWNIM